MTSFHSMSGTATVSNRRYRYNGKERDEETGLYYYGARYYAAWLGRWTAVDPAGLRGGMNLYAYVGNRPIGQTDPSGAMPVQTDGSVVAEVVTPDLNYGRKFSSGVEEIKLASENYEVSHYKFPELDIGPGAKDVAPTTTAQPVSKDKPSDAAATKNADVSVSPKKEEKLTAQTGLGRIAEAVSKGDYTAAATEYAATIVTSIPNVAVGIALFHAAEKAYTAYEARGVGAGLWSAGTSVVSYDIGLIPVIPSAVATYESGRRTSHTQGAERTGAAVDTYVQAIQTITQAVGLVGGLKAGGAEKLGSEAAEESEPKGSSVGAMQVDTGKWGAGSYKTPYQSLLDHFRRHGTEVGATDEFHYLRQAEAFALRLRGARRFPVEGPTPGVTRYVKAGKYIDIGPGGQIISFGARP